MKENKKIPECVGTLNGNWAIIISVGKTKEEKERLIKEADEWIDRQRRWPFNWLFNLFKSS